MATLLFRAPTQDPDPGLFWLHQTFMELPETVPMDLASLVSMSMQTAEQSRMATMSQCWSTLMTTGCTAEDWSLAECYPAKAMARMRELHREAGLEEAWTRHQVCSVELAQTFAKAEAQGAEPAALLAELQACLDKHDLLVKPSFFYESVSETWRWYWSQNQETFPEIDLFTYPSEATMVADYQAAEHGMPLSIIPHAYRSHGFFREQCEASHQAELIPGFGHDGALGGDDLPF